MSLSTSHLAYIDCEEAFDRAIASEHGIRIRVANIDAATFFRMRCHKFRQLKRDEAKQIYEKGDPKHGVTPYDAIVIRIYRIEDACYCYMQPTTLPGEIEELDAGTDNRAPMVGRAMPELVEQSQGQRDRLAIEDQREERVDELPVRGPEVPKLRRI